MSSKIHEQKTSAHSRVFLILSVKFNAKTTFEANALLDKWHGFDTLLTTFLLLSLYNILRHALEYLQTRGLDYLSAWNMVLTAKQELWAVKFEDVNRTAATFVSEVNRCLT